MSDRGFADFLGGLVDCALFPGGNEYSYQPISPKSVTCPSAHPEYRELFFSELHCIQEFRQRDLPESEIIVDLASEKMRLVRGLRDVVARAFAHESYPLHTWEGIPADQLSSPEAVSKAAQELMDDDARWLLFQTRIFEALTSAWRQGGRTFILTKGHPNDIDSQVVASFTTRPPLSTAELLAGNSNLETMARDWWEHCDEGQTMESLIEAGRQTFLNSVGGVVDRGCYYLALLSVDPELPKPEGRRSHGIGTLMVMLARNTMFLWLGTEGFWGLANNQDWDRQAFYERLGGTSTKIMRGGLPHAMIQFSPDVKPKGA